MDTEQYSGVGMPLENSILEASYDESGMHENDIDQRQIEDNNNEENIFYESNTEGNEVSGVQEMELGIIHPEFMYNKHDESIFDDEHVFPSLSPEAGEIVKFDDNNPELINHATLKALIVQLTSPEVIDYNLICDFFLTYRIFVDSEKVMNMLLIRLIWSLQYINSNNKTSVRIGKLVLLRTFVVMRHWMLNYFVDDFDSNSLLCDIFTYNINQITNESNLVTDNMCFEQKVIKDLKIHWISLLNEFWNVGIDVDIIADNILQYRLPMTSEVSNVKKLSKSNTEMSIHTNASYRRSAMLSLYDAKVQHKCLVFDANGNDENPQLSINNLLLHHQSSRLSVNAKLQELKDKKLKDVTVGNKPLSSSTKHNHMNLQDSSLGLKKTSKNKKVSPEENKDRILTPIKNKENTNPNYKLSPVRMDDIGFSTNGNIKLPSSKVNLILPPTPVKKMNCIIKQTNVNDASFHKPNHFIKDGKYADDASEDFGRKKSLKKFVDGWKKSFNHSSSDTMHHANNTTNNKHGNKDMNNLVMDAMNVMSENDEEKIGGRVDILSARAVDELEYLIRYYVRNDSPCTIIERDIDGDEDYSKSDALDEFVEVSEDINLEEEKINQYDNESIDIMASPARKARVTSTNPSIPVRGKIENIDDQEDSSAIDINDLSELNIKKIDNLINNDELDTSEQQHKRYDSNQRSHTPVDQIIDRSFNTSNRSSFQRAASINWNDEGNLDLEYSEGKTTSSSQDFDDEVKSPISRDQSFGLATGPPDPQYIFNNQSNKSFESSISTQSNITHYNAEVADLGIALSPQLMKKNSVRRISFNEVNLTKNNNNRKRMSALSKNSSGSMFRKDSRNSARSYVSYDSAFSISNGSVSYKNRDTDNGDLRKKTAYTDLRTVVGINDQRPALDSRISMESMSMNSYLSRSSSLRKSVRFSTLCALTELPFGEYNASNTSADRRAPSLKKEIRQPDISDSSFFSVAARSKTNSVVGNEQNTQNSHNSSNNSVAIPGISNFVLKELADIPDETFQLDSPLDHAFYKLEGKKSNSSDCKDEKKQEEEKQAMNTEQVPNERHATPDNTQDILNEINNANTQDIDDFPSDIVDMTQERPLTPVKNMMVVKSPRKKTNGGSLHNSESIFFINSNGSSPSQYPSPRTILNGYYISTDILSIEKVMNMDSHISFLLSYDSKSLADHFTIIEKDILQEIDWKELIELKWNKELVPVNSWLEIIVNDNYFYKNRGVNLVIARFNLMVNWIISEILMSKTQRERINIISRLIHIAHNCYVLQNFSTLMQIILGLTSEKVLKLKETWKNLSPGDILILKNLEELSSPIKNFLNIRMCINRIKPSNGCIPFVGLYLSDLIFNSERPAFIKPKISHAAKNNDTTGGDSTLNTQNIAAKMINFSRFRTSVHIVKSLSQCIEWSSHYDLLINRDLLSKCLYIKSLDEEEMNFCLLNIVDS